MGERRRGKRGSGGDAGICFFLQLTKEEGPPDRPTAKEAYYSIWEMDARSVTGRFFFMGNVQKGRRK